ncbi:TspO/MBR family protein [Corynebacterium sp.]|uniref:TspO/MBR family protein n=1 Tax=Corynebacterium sp. TaxID=1720 RepID=UPI003736EA4F
MNFLERARKKRRRKIVGGTGLATAAAATLGTIATDPDSIWYRTRRKPSFQPPKWLFPVAWTALYTDIALVSGLSIADADEANDEQPRNSLATALGINLALNAGWCALFFRSKSPALATAGAAALTVSSADLTRRAMQVNKTRGAWLIPYPLWSAFATVLSAAIWRKN